MSSVSHAGARYATLDAEDKDSEATGCQDDYLDLPAGWIIAPHDESSINVTAAYPWGTHLLVYADGGQRYTHHPSYRSQAGETRYWVTTIHPTALGSQGTGYKVNACARRILIKALPGTCSQSGAGGPTGTTTPSPADFSSAELAHCSLGKTWKQLLTLTQTAKGRITTGGLGKRLVQRFKVWVCDRDNDCSEADNAMCFVYDEFDNVFIPWGLKRRLFPRGTSS